MKRILLFLFLAVAPTAVSADGWVYSVPDGLNWWDQGILEWTDSSGFHNVVSNVSRSGTSLTIGNNGSNPQCVNLDFSGVSESKATGRSWESAAARWAALP